MWFDSIKSASRMNSAIVTFLDDISKVEKVVESGVVVSDSFTPVLPLVSPAKKIMISNRRGTYCLLLPPGQRGAQVSVDS